MNSTLKFDINGSNEPVIAAVVSYDSDDLRDKVADRFFGSLWGAPCLMGETPEVSRLCFVESRGLEPGKHLYHISPVPFGCEDKYIDRLQSKQCASIIPLAFQVLSNDDAKDVLKSCPIQLLEIETKTDTNRLPSSYQIEDNISTEDIFDGQVVAVKFTIGKVYYDILDKLSGKVIENVDSAQVTHDPIVKLSQA